MPTMDATAKAALDESVIAPAFFLYLDVSGDPIRITTFGKDVTFAATGDTDLDTFTFSSMDARAIEVGDVKNAEGGSETLTIDLSGIISIDQDLLDAIGDQALWRGRTARLWFQLYSMADAAVGAIVPYYTGYMSSVSIIPSPTTQAIRLSVENYLAAFNQPSNRSYLDQARYDAADISAGATIVAANGARHGGASSGGMGTSSSYSELSSSIRAVITSNQVSRT